MTSPTDLLRIKELFLATSDLPPERWTAHLDSVGATGPVREKVLRQLQLLALTDREPKPAFGAAAAEEDPKTIGPYRVVRRLGQGGMGVVYLAWQDEPIRRQVAIKRIRAGMGSASLLQRFEAERQALARMDHPGIARVLDAGVDQDQRPYVVMEFLDGPSLLHYADQHRLGIDARLQLFLGICRGVQHAHQRGVLHRDLKPSNILVVEDDGRPRPKIIDFGLAKALGDAVAGELTRESLHTRAGALLGTPEYMSPEQADPGQREVDTRSDVWSLGVILYELLTGVLPHDGATPAEAPKRPSTRASTAGEHGQEAAMRRGLSPQSWVSRLRGDLDWITMRALEPEKEQRYASPGHLADDIERHLRHEAVTAGPPSRTYRLRKFVRRFRIQVAAGVLVVLSLAVGTVVSVDFALQTGEKARLAQQESERARDSALAADSARRATERANEFLQRLLGFLDPDIALTADLSTTEFLDRTTQAAYTELADQPATLAKVLTTVGRVYWLRGAFAPAQKHLVKALTLRDADPATTPKELREVLWPLAWLAWQTNGELIGSTWIRCVHASREFAAADLPELDRTLRNLITWSSNRYGYCDGEAALREFEALATSIPDGDPRWVALGDVVLSVGDGLYMLGERLDLAQRVYAQAERVYRGRAGLPESHSRLALLHEMMIVTAYGTGEFARGEAIAKDTVRALSTVLPEDHWHLAVFRAWQGAMMHRRGGDRREALQLLAGNVKRTTDVIGGGTSVTLGPAMELITLLEWAGRAEETRALRLAIAAGLPNNIASNGIQEEVLNVVIGPGHQPLVDDLRYLGPTRRKGIDYPPEVLQPVLERVLEYLPRKIPERVVREAVHAWLLNWNTRYRESGGSPAIANLLWRVLADDLAANPNPESRLARAVAVADAEPTKDGEARLRALLEEVRSRGPEHHDLNLDWNMSWYLAQNLAIQGRFDEAMVEAKAGYHNVAQLRGEFESWPNLAFTRLSELCWKSGDWQACVEIAAARIRVLLRGGATPQALNAASRALVRVAGLDRHHYGLALQAAELAAEKVATVLRLQGEPRWLPTFAPALQNTMGIARYRCGDYRGAIANLERSDALARSPKAEDPIFLALAHHALGEVDAARTAVAKAIELVERTKAEKPPTGAWQALGKPQAYRLFEELDALRGTASWPR